MQAGRTQLRGLRCFVQVAAIEATPGDCSIACENAPVLEIRRQVLVTFAMLFFGDGDTLESNSNLGKALFTGDLGELGIELAPLVFLASGRGLQVLQRWADFASGVSVGNFDFASFQKAEKTLGVFFFLGGSFFENLRNLHQALFARRAGKKRITISRL